MKTVNDIISMIVAMFRDDESKKIAVGKCGSCRNCFGRTNGCYFDMYVISICYVIGGEY